MREWGKAVEYEGSCTATGVVETCLLYVLDERPFPVL